MALEMKRLVCVVEGMGEVRAVPNLAARLIRYLGNSRWVVDQEPIRLPRSQLVDERVPSPARPPREDGLARAIELTVARAAHAALLLVDSDDDCPAAFGPAARARMRKRLPSAAVMAVREYETWLLWSLGEDRLRSHRIRPGSVRDAKRALTRVFPGYTPTTHQLAATRALDIDRVRMCPDSFDKLVRDVGDLIGSRVPVRPGAH